MFYDENYEVFRLKIQNVEDDIWNFFFWISCLFVLLFGAIVCGYFGTICTMNAIMLKGSGE